LSASPNMQPVKNPHSMGRIAQPVLGNVQSVLSRYLSTTPNRPFSLPSEHAAQYRVPRPLTCIPSSFISPRRMLPNVGPGQLGLGLVEPRCFMYHHITCLVFKSLPPSTRKGPRLVHYFPPRRVGGYIAPLPILPHPPPTMSSHPGEESCMSSRFAL